MKLITCILIIHIFLLVAMFDVYFRTPITSGIEPVENNCGPLTKRVVIFVGDGLRSDIFFKGDESKNNYNPYLSQLIENGASWGISYTHLPTESRPGHVALFAGFYEDPSAVFKGWKGNLVPFDSVFNRSTASFSWGSPDIVPIFSYGNPNIFWQSYSHLLQDFSGKNGTAAYLNYWVLDKFNETVMASYANDTLKQLMGQEGIIYFFHLLGIDVAGHAKKPHSDYYKENIRITDEIVRKLVTIIDNYYGDSNTTYIFTSDHGMTDWGSHGAGSESETNTPLVVWGSGIKRTECNEMDLPPYYIQSMCKKDVYQADIAVLISVLLGNPIPVNSVGVVPLTYLDLGDAEKLSLAFMNAKQLLNQFKKKESDIKQSTLKLFFVPYSHLQPQNQDFLMEKIHIFTMAKNYTAALEYIHFLLAYSLDGINYYHTYFQFGKLYLLTFIFLGEIGFILSKLLPYVVYSRKEYGPFPDEALGHPMSSISKQSIITSLVVITILMIFIGTVFPVEFLLYLVILVPLWIQCWEDGYWIPVFLRIFKSKRAIIFVLSYLGGVEIIFWSFFHRWVLVLGLIVPAVWLYLDKSTFKLASIVRHLWLISSICLSIFPLLPTVGTDENIIYVYGCATIWFFLGLLFTYLFKISQFGVIDWCLVLKLLLIIPTLWNLYHIEESFNADEGLNLLNQIISYVLLVTYFTLMFYGQSNIIPRYTTVAFSLGMSFLLFCSSHESFFSLAMAFHLGLWITIEITKNGYPVAEILNIRIGSSRYERKIILVDDIRRCFFFLYYILFSFFGIGNIDSINSFDLTWVRGFITLFSPFLMTGLILLKTLIPFILVTCAFRFILLNSKVTVTAMFLIVLIFCDILGLQFLYCIKNEGSWLEIGKSISHYVIVQVTTMVLIVLYYLTGHIIKTPSQSDKSLLPLYKDN